MREWTDPRDGERYYVVRTRARHLVEGGLVPTDLVAFWSVRGVVMTPAEPGELDGLEETDLVALLDRARAFPGPAADGSRDEAG